MSIVLTNASVSVNTVALGASCKSVTLNYEVDAINIDAMGMTGHRFTGGMANLSVTLELINAEGVGSVMETLYAATGSGGNTLVIRNTSTGATFTISNAFLAASTPVVGSVGELSVQSVTFTGGTLVKS